MQIHNNITYSLVIINWHLNLTYELDFYPRIDALDDVMANECFASEMRLLIKSSHLYINRTFVMTDSFSVRKFLKLKINSHSEVIYFRYCYFLTKHRKEY